MAEAKGRLLVVTNDRALADQMASAASARGLELSCAAGLREAAVQLSQGVCAALVVDFGRIPAAEREAALALRQQAPRAACFFLETNLSIAPDTPASLRQLPWPLPSGFADKLRVTERPVVMLADQTLFATEALHAALQQAGVQIVSLESTNGLASFLREQKEARAPKPEAKKPFWRFGASSKSDAETGSERPVLSRVVVALFSGTVPEAAKLDIGIRQVVPEAVCYFVPSLEPGRAAVAAIEAGQTASLMRELAGGIPELLTAGDEAQKTPPRGGGRILLAESNKAYVIAMGQALMVAGYEVVTAGDGEEALRHFRPGAYDLSVIGTAIAYGQHSGAEFAQKLRKQDPDLRIIFIVDQFPAETVTKRLGEVVKLGLDDALVRPVEPVQLVESVRRALERRFLLLRNAQLSRENEDKNRALTQINDFQKKFFAMVAHDVKNPLTAIMGYSEVLGTSLKDNPRNLKYASHIHSAAGALNLLISDLVDLAAIESGKLRVEIGPLDLADVVNEVRARIEIVAQKRQIIFAVDLPPALPSLAGDPARLGQVIQNLCTNAIQYTKEGGKVTVRVEVFADKVVVSVIDTGIGISAQDLPHVWERFFQSEEAKKMRKAGFGLGLKIAREIVQMHGGEMGLESQLGVGSRFFFVLPVKAAKEPQAVPSPAASGERPAPSGTVLPGAPPSGMVRPSALPPPAPVRPSVPPQKLPPLTDPPRRPEGWPE